MRRPEIQPSRLWTGCASFWTSTHALGCRSLAPLIPCSWQFPVRVLVQIKFDFRVGLRSTRRNNCALFVFVLLATHHGTAEQAVCRACPTEWFGLVSRGSLSPLFTHEVHRASCVPSKVTYGKEKKESAQTNSIGRFSEHVSSTKGVLGYWFCNSAGQPDRFRRPARRERFCMS